MLIYLGIFGEKWDGVTSLESDLGGATAVQRVLAHHPFGKVDQEAQSSSPDL